MQNFPLLVVLVFALNAIWFGAAFKFFCINPTRAAKLLTPPSAGQNVLMPLPPTLAASLRFLGGMNFALAAFAVLLLCNQALFPLPKQVALFALVFAIAHASQFIYNVPIAIQNYRGDSSLWWVLKGRMLFIFVVDFMLMMANTVVAVLL
jgi:hypothetical protein